MTENVLAALVGGLVGSLTGGAFALLTLIISQHYEAKRRAEEAQSQREAAQTATDQWYAEFFMTRRLEALTDLQQALIKIRYYPPTKPPRFRLLLFFSLRNMLRDIDYELNNLERARTVAETYLDADAKKLIDSIPPKVKTVQNIALHLLRAAPLAFVSPSRRQNLVSSMQLAESINADLGANILAAIRYISEQMNPQSLRLYAEQQKPHLTAIVTPTSSSATKLSRHTRKIDES